MKMTEADLGRRPDYDIYVKSTIWDSMSGGVIAKLETNANPKVDRALIIAVVSHCRHILRGEMNDE